MQKMYVKFTNVDQVKNFVSIIDKMEANFELGVGRRVIDPKSILGIFTLDLTQPQELRCDEDELHLSDHLEEFVCCKKRCYVRR